MIDSRYNELLEKNEELKKFIQSLQIKEGEELIIEGILNSFQSQTLLLGLLEEKKLVICKGSF